MLAAPPDLLLCNGDQMCEASVGNGRSGTHNKPGADLRVWQIRFPQTRTVYRTLLVILVTLGVAVIAIGCFTRFDFGVALSAIHMIGVSATYCVIVTAVSFLAWRQRQLRLNVVLVWFMPVGRKPLCGCA